MLSHFFYRPYKNLSFLDLNTFAEALSIAEKVLKNSSIFFYSQIKQIFYI